MSLKLIDAGPAEILRASQKDKRYTQDLQQNVLDVIVRILGSRPLMKFSSHIKVLTDFTYYGFLALSNSQTLGEEYTGILQVESSFITVPNKILQLMNIVLQSGGELCLQMVFASLRKNIKSNDNLESDAKDIILKLIYIISGLQPFILQIHRGLFFISGGYFHISKRFTSINYVLIRHWMKDYSFARGFKLLGIITLLHSVLNCAIILTKSINVKDNDFENKLQNHITTGKLICKCVLCLCDISSSSAPPCGHIFCWNCIIDCLRSKAECPVCREPVQNSQIVLLQNFS